MNKLKQIAAALLIAFSSFGVAQQPQSQAAPVVAVNSKYVNGVAPGFQVLAGSGLNLSLGPGTSFCNGTVVQYAGGTLSLTASTTNNVYLNTASSCAPAVKTSAFTATDIPIAFVVTSGSAITSITDLRTFFITPSSGGGHNSVGATGAVQVAGASGAFGDSGCTNPSAGILICTGIQTVGAGAGGWDYTESTTQTPIAGHDIVQALTSAHAFQLSNNGDAFSNLLRQSDAATVCIPGSPVALTDGATVTWAIGTKVCQNAKLLFTTHGGSRTLNLTGLVSSGNYELVITQDGTGGEGLTLGTGCTWKVGNGGAGAITTTATANAIDSLAFWYDGTNCYLNFSPNYN